MAHRLKPHTHYRIVTVLVAVPDDAMPGAISDGINELLRPSTCCEEPDADCPVVVDYAFTAPEDSPTCCTEDAPEEGDLFADFDWSTGLRPRGEGRAAAARDRQELRQRDRWIAFALAAMTGLTTDDQHLNRLRRVLTEQSGHAPAAQDVGYLDASKVLT